jgi:hypothetical protein
MLKPVLWRLPIQHLSRDIGGCLVFSSSGENKLAEDTQPRKIASIVNCMFGSHFKHISRTNMLCHFVLNPCSHNIKQFWSMFGSHFKENFKNKHAVLNNCSRSVWKMAQSIIALLLLKPRTNYTTCLKSARHVKKFWSMFGSHFKHVWRTNMLCHPVSNTCSHHT